MVLWIASHPKHPVNDGALQGCFADADLFSELEGDETVASFILSGAHSTLN